MRKSITTIATAIIVASSVHVGIAQVIEGFYSKVKFEEFTLFGEVKYKISIDLDTNKQSKSFSVGRPNLFKPPKNMIVQNGDTLRRVYRPPASPLKNLGKSDPFRRDYSYSTKGGNLLNVNVSTSRPRTSEIRINVDGQGLLTIELYECAYDSLSGQIKKYLEIRKTDLLSIVLDGNAKMETVNKILNQIDIVRNSMAGIKGPVLKPRNQEIAKNAIAVHVRPNQILINNKEIIEKDVLDELKNQLKEFDSNHIVLMIDGSTSLDRFHMVRKELTSLEGVEIWHRADE